MGEAKRKQYSRKQFLRDHPVCCYCGAAATTTDHCPPRSFFVHRAWPEGFEFPACKTCNASGRYDEQIASIIFGTSLHADTPVPDWRLTAASLRRHRPDVIREWFSLSRNTARRHFRERFGAAGDEMRRLGYGVIGLGPASNRVIEAFAAKLAQALYYKHVGRRLIGSVWLSLIYPESLAAEDDEIFDAVPFVVRPTRSGSDLGSQFAYRFNEGAHAGLFAALVRIREQFNLFITAVETHQNPTALEDLGEPIASFV